ncbi:CPBP family intramembrane glutamic endopeptidase [Methanobrevibacter sp.]|uniref:CPBP family intramembrane glutamic endopeptidase n=1 Tax=Methanobrevibacter sp. TaxID=66852 RepID=UPI0025F7C3C2|nr:type II CAAX endopeptidase family protein [Methanobrevibacter sp.]
MKSSCNILLEERIKFGYLFRLGYIRITNQYLIDKMSYFNDKLKNITLKEVLSLIIILFVIQYMLNVLNIVYMDSVWIYIVIIFYFIFKLRNEIFTIKKDIFEVFEYNTVKLTISLVVLNIFFSYGMLYFSDYILNIMPSFNLSNSFLASGLFATIIVSPISEELIFRGVFFNRLQLIIPTVFAILISSLLFASLHGFGSIFSAFVFALCVAILYFKTENIFVAIFAHFLNNVIAEIIVFADSGKILFTNYAVIGLMSILAIGSFIIISYFVIKELNTINYNNS